MFSACSFYINVHRSQYQAKPSAPAFPTLQMKRELLLDEHFSAPDISVNSKRDNSVLDSRISVASQGNHMGTRPLVSSDATGSEVALQKTTSDSGNDIRSTQLRRPFAKSSIELPNGLTLNSQKAGASTGRTPPIGSKGLSNPLHSSVPSGRPQFPISGPNMIPVPSAPRAIASVMPAARGVFFAPTGPPVTTSPARLSSTLRPEGPELPIPSPGNLSVPTSAPQTIPTSPKQSRSYSPQVQVSNRKQNLKRSRKASSSACSRSRSSSVSISSRESHSRSRSHSPRHSDTRGQKKCHRLPRRLSVSRAVSAQTGDPSPWSRSRPMARIRSKRSRSRSMSSSRSQSSAPRRRNYSYSRPPSPSPSPSGHRDSSQASSRRYWSPDSDRQSRGRSDRKDRVLPQSRRVPLHDHWSPGGGDRRRQSSRSRWSSEESVDNAQDPLPPDVNTLAQPMNPDHGGRRKTGAPRLCISLAISVSFATLY